MSIHVCGIDWAAQSPTRVAVVLQVEPLGTAAVEAIMQRLSDRAAVDFCRDQSLDTVALDTPFGWPVAFRRFVASWTPKAGGQPAPESLAYRFRHTDLVVHQHLAKWPLSVSSDRIALAARSWVQLVEREGLCAQIDLGDGDVLAKPRLIEVYPAATLMAFCRQSATVGGELYRKDTRLRAQLLDRLIDCFSVQCTPSEHTTILNEGGATDCFDAFVAGLTAAMYGGHVPGWALLRPAGEEQRQLARQEGWIFFPASAPVR